MLVQVEVERPQGQTGLGDGLYDRGSDEFAGKALDVGTLARQEGKVGMVMLLQSNLGP